MSPIPGEPLDPTPQELTTSDGRKFKLKIPGLTPPEPAPAPAEARDEPEADEQP